MQLLETTRVESPFSSAYSRMVSQEQIAPEMKSCGRKRKREEKRRRKPKRDSESPLAAALHSAVRAGFSVLRRLPYIGKLFSCARRKKSKTTLASLVSVVGVDSTGANTRGVEEPSFARSPRKN